MSLRFGSGWLAIYFLICSCTFIGSPPQLRARDYTTFNPSPPWQGRPRPLRLLDREGVRQAVVGWGLFRIPKGLKWVERREAGRGAGVHAPQSEFTFRTYCRPLGNYPERGRRNTSCLVAECLPTSPQGQSETLSVDVADNEAP